MVNYKNKIAPIVQSAVPMLSALFFATLFTLPLFLLLGGPEDISTILILSSTEIFGMGIGALIFMYVAKNHDLMGKYSYNYFKIIHWDKLNNINVKSYIAWTIMGLAGLFAANFIITILTSIIDVEMAENILFEVAESDPVYILYYIPIMLLLVGPVEEFLFRGILQSVLREHYGLKIGLFIASLVFGLIHIPAAGGMSQGAVVYVLTTFSLGMILGYIYEIKESLLIPVVIHGVYNSILLVGYYYMQVGM